MDIVDDNPKLTCIFPTAIYTATPANKEKYIDIFKNNSSEYKFNKIERHSGAIVLTGEYIGNISIHHNPAYEEFFRMITTHANQYVHSLGVRNEVFDYYVNKCWLSIIQDPEDHMRYHSHSNSDVSFVYYVEVPENADCISFNNVNKPNELFFGMFDEPEKQQDDKVFLRERNVANFSSFFFTPHPGLLVMFPGKLPHGTIPDPLGSGPQKGTRIAIVGDISMVLKPGHHSFESGRINLEHMRKFND